MNITAKITTTALLFFLALFSLTTCLKAQESGQQAGQARKTGWFVGVSPYFLGAEIKTTTENTTLTERYTNVTRTLDATNVAFTASTTDQVEGVRSDSSFVYSSDYGNRAISAVLDICEDGIYNGDANSYNAQNFDATSNTEPAATANTDVSACFNHFQELAASFSPSLTGIEDSTSSLSFSTTSENTPLNGNGLQLGYNFEKFRVSLNSHLWSAGESKLDSQLLLLDYFLPYGLYAGGGFGMAKLDTSIGSASKTAPALHFGYQHNFTNNFSLEAGLLWFGASFSLGKSAAAPEATISDIAIPAIPSPIISSALVGASLGTPPLNNISFIAFVYNNNHINSNSFSDEDRRILVTGTVTPAYSATQSGSKINEATTPTKITHEVEAPTSIFIRFVWKFR